MRSCVWGCQTNSRKTVFRVSRWVILASGKQKNEGVVKGEPALAELFLWPKQQHWEWKCRIERRGRQQRSCCKISKKTGTSAQEKNVSSQNERSISHSQETLQTCSCNVSLPRKQKWDDCLARRTKQILQGAWKHQQKDSLSKSGVDKFSQLRLSKTLFKEPADNACRRARFTKIQSQFTLSS